MTRETDPPGRCPDADPSIVTRQEALRDALQARRSPELDREFSTLVERSEPVSDGHDDHGWQESSLPQRREDQGVAADQLEQNYDRLLSAVESYVATSPCAPAGGTDGNRDEVEKEQGAVPDPATESEQEQHDAREQK